MRLVQQRTFLFVMVAATFLAVESWIATYILVVQDANLLAFAVTVDVVVGIPALYYFLVVRPKRSSLVSLAPTIFLSLLAARWILPASQHTYLNQIEWVAVLVEVGLLVYFASRVRAIARSYPAERAKTPYVLEALEASIGRAVGRSRLVTVLATELSLLYFGVVSWFKPTPTLSGGFSTHRRSGYGIVVGLLGLMVLVETVALHLIVQLWNDGVAWLLTVLSFYSILWLVADWHAIRLQPFLLVGNVLHLRVGLRWRATLPLQAVAEVRRPIASELKGNDYLNMAVFGQPRLLITLHEPVMAQGPFGIQRAIRRLGLTVDEEEQFQEEVRRQIVPSD